MTQKQKTMEARHQGYAQGTTFLSTYYPHNLVQLRIHVLDMNHQNGSQPDGYTVVTGQKGECQVRALKSLGICTQVDHTGLTVC